MIQQLFASFTVFMALFFMGSSPLYSFDRLSQISASTLENETDEMVDANRKLDQLLYSTIDRFIYHVTEGFIGDDIIVLEDGSEWQTSKHDKQKLKDWRVYDWVTITPKHWATGDCKYYLNNNTIGISVEVQLVPWEDLPSFQIIGNTITEIYQHHDTAKIRLSNGTYWIVQSDDAKKIRNWEVGHTVIFGDNDAWFTLYKMMLINANLDQYVYAKERLKDEDQ